MDFDQILKILRPSRPSPLPPARPQRSSKTDLKNGPPKKHAKSGKSAENCVKRVPIWRPKSAEIEQKVYPDSHTQHSFKKVTQMMQNKRPINPQKHRFRSIGVANLQFCSICKKDSKMMPKYRQNDSQILSNWCRRRPKSDAKNKLENTHQADAQKYDLCSKKGLKIG